MNFKRGYKKPARNVTWSSPKEHQIDFKNLDKEHGSKSHKRKNNSKYCSKLKGPHQFELFSTKVYKHAPGPGMTTYLLYKCKVCKKEKGEWKRDNS